MAQGEIISTNLFHIYQTELGKNSKLIAALDFMSIDEHDEPDTTTIESKLKTILAKESNYNTYITQGYICNNS